MSGSGPLRLESVLGNRLDPDLHERLHDIEHAGGLEILRLSTADTARKRLRLATDRGTDCAIILPRSERLFDGAVLHLDDRRAIIVRVAEERWLRLTPADGAAALELGYHAGNLHWRVRFEGGDLLVALEGGATAYLDRLRPYLGPDRFAFREEGAS